MTIGLTGIIILGLIGALFYVGAIEQIGKIDNPKTMRRISYLFFVLAFLWGLLDSTPTP